MSNRELAELSLSPDLMPTLRRFDAKARAHEASLRTAPYGSHHYAEAILEALTGHTVSTDLRVRLVWERTALVCQAKAIRILASMLASAHGHTIPISGLLVDLAPPP